MKYALAALTALSLTAPAFAEESKASKLNVVKSTQTEAGVFGGIGATAMVPIAVITVGAIAAVSDDEETVATTTTN